MPVLRFLLVILLVIGVSGCRTELYTGLTEQDANEILAILQTNGIPAGRKADADGQIAVMVEEAQFASAVEILRSEGYPKRQYSDLGQVFQGNGFVVSQTEERARFIFAMSEELSQTISEIDGVISARTHVVLPTSDPLSRNSTPSSASVVIRHAAGSDTEKLMPQIKTMVANSIEGLSYSHVSVVFIPVAARTLEERGGQVANDLRGEAARWPLSGLGLRWMLLALIAGAGMAMAGMAVLRRAPVKRPGFAIEKVADGEAGR